MKKDKKTQIRDSLSAVFKNSKRSATPQKIQIPQIFLQALKVWDKGYVQLKRRAFYEYINLKQRWGFFILLLMLSDYKTGTLRITTKHLIQVSDLHRISVYKILKFLHDLKYITYAPAKNQYHKNTESDKMTIKIPGYDSYVKIQKVPINAATKNLSAIQNGSSESIPAPQSAGSESIPALRKGGNFLLDLYKTLDERQSKTKSAGSESIPALTKIKPCSSSKTKSAGSESIPALTKNQNSPLRARVKDFKDVKDIIMDDDEILKLFKEKTNQEIPTDTVKKLLQRSDQDVILKHIKRLNWDLGIENPIGLLIDSLENPQHYPVLERESQEERDERERLQREKKEKEKQEELKRLEEERRKSEEVERRFSQLPQNKRDSYIKQAEEELRKENPNLTEETLREIILRDHNVKIKAIEIMRREKVKN